MSQEQPKTENPEPQVSHLESLDLPLEVNNYIDSIFKNKIAPLAEQLSLLKNKPNKTNDDLDKELALATELSNLLNLINQSKQQKRIVENTSNLESELFEQINIETQYQSQIEILKKTNITQKLSNKEQGIIGIDQKEYPIPTLDQIKEKILEKESILKKKIEQGFVKLLIVPFAMPLESLIDKYRQTILKHHKNHTLKATNGDTLELNENEPVWVWDKYNNADTNNKLIYYPKEFSSNHQGHTKQALLNSPSDNLAGWHVLLIEDLPDLPAETKGETINQRKQLESNQTPKQYLETLQTDPQYQHEQGLTPEDWLIYAISQLEEKNQVIDDWQGKGKVSYNLGAYFPFSGDVPLGYWNRGSRRAYLGGNVPRSRHSGFGLRSAVGI